MWLKHQKFTDEPEIGEKKFPNKIKLKKTENLIASKKTSGMWTGYCVSIFTIEYHSSMSDDHRLLSGNYGRLPGHYGLLVYWRKITNEIIKSL